jgi:hypothetical protein
MLLSFELFFFQLPSELKYSSCENIINKLQANDCIQCCNDKQHTQAANVLMMGSERVNTL